MRVIHVFQSLILGAMGLIILSGLPSPDFPEQTNVLGTVTAGFSLSDVTAAVVKEGGSDNYFYTISTNTEPTADVTVTAKITDGECVIATYPAKPGSATSQSLVFADSATSTIKLAVAAVDDKDVEDAHFCTVKHTVSSADTDYNAKVIPDRKVKITDNDTKVVTDTTKTEEVVKEVKTEVKPDVPKTVLKDESGQDVISTDDKPVVFDAGKPIVLAGTTVPKGKVAIYIFSTPQEGTVTADDDGEWTYTIEQIEPGDHRVEVEVTDPETGLVSEREQVLAFQVVQAEEAPVATVQEPESRNEQLDNGEDNSNAMFMAGLVAGAVILIAAIAFVVYKFAQRRKQHTTLPDQAQMVMPDSQTDTTTTQVQEENNLQNQETPPTDEGVDKK